MSDQPENQAGMRRETGRQFGVALLAGLVVVVVISVGAYFLLRGGAGAPGALPPLPWGAAEQAYAAQIKFGNFNLTRATNMLKMEITNVDGAIQNGGDKSVVDVEVALEFEDLSHKVIFRDSRRILTGAPALAAGETRAFRLSFDNVPAGWNQVPPKFTITGMQLQ